MKRDDVNEIIAKDKTQIASYLWAIVKSFLLVFSTCAILVGGFNILIARSFAGINKGIEFGLYCSFALIPLLIIFDLFERIRCFYRFKRTSFVVRQKRKYSCLGDYNTIFQNTLRAIQICDFEIQNEDINAGIILATSKRTWKSFGEKLFFNIRPLTQGQIMIIMDSKPKLVTTTFDYCKNFINLEIISKELFSKENGAKNGVTH